MTELISLLAPFAIEILENEPMSRHTTFKIGGQARLYILPRNIEAVVKIVAICHEHNEAVFALGNGSNLLISDKGIDAVVVSTASLTGIRMLGERIICYSGTLLSDVCRAARDSELTGLEFAYGIPGTVGGAVYMNAGAYGGEMKDVVVKTRHIDGEKSNEFDAQALCFGYRHSAYTGTDKLITTIELALKYGESDKINARMEELIKRRRSKQPLEYPSAGSVFKRPIGNYSGTLIESCGLKGSRIGGAMVSEKHAGFIINVGEATCSDVLALIAKIKDDVFKQTGVELESEIKFIGIC